MIWGTSVTEFQLVTFIAGVVLPIVAGVVTRYQASSRTRSLMLLALSFISGILNSWLVAPSGFDWSQATFNALTQFVVGVAVLYGLWKPTGVSEAAKRSLR
jgi:peptidoglycan/LPS O-acetylase OafA/YrhL